jgi:hypothetical protein
MYSPPFFSCDIYEVFMPYLPSLQRLRKQFEELTSSLNACENSAQRRDLLKRMKEVIAETDRIISAEVLRVDSKPDSSNSPSDFDDSTI